MGCIHLYTTWNKHFPYGCKAMGFKSARLPCEVVRQSSGQECLAYVQKPRVEPLYKDKWSFQWGT